MRVLALAGICAALIACRGGSRRDPVAEAVKAGLEAQLDVKVEQVRCERAGCEATLAGGATLKVKVDGDRELAWETDEVVMTGALAARIRAELGALGVDTTVDCGAPRVTVPGEPVRCELGSGGAVWAAIRDDGEVELEVALTPAIVQARTEDVDVQGLDDLSRALDTDEAQGAGPEDPEADAGVGAAADAR
ncbi:MAG TPA: hypothetical protein VM734_29050 [Kofleriaceae bacterium]|jgi:hypothetical protein|nr:hypothetical protein [Kofleriaceae bacterium]